MVCPALKLAMPVDYNVHQLQRPQSLPFPVACCAFPSRMPGTVWALCSMFLRNMARRTTEQF